MYRCCLQHASSSDTLTAQCRTMKPGKPAMVLEGCLRGGCEGGEAKANAKMLEVEFLPVMLRKSDCQCRNQQLVC